VAVPPFIEFGERIINTTRIVSIAPPKRTADGHEIEARIDGFSHKEVYGNIEDADDRYDTLATLLLDMPPAHPVDAAEESHHLRAMLSSLADDLAG
jgi:hypothetical protein